jgi:2-C-methyl-D-erythritol 2,4-cyclodiphosphate synthase
MTIERRAGIGYDAHRFGEGRTLVLGGVEIPDEPGLEGHSDADVLTHAITDALLGAAGLGDIGGHFPDDDPRYRDADSIGLLTQSVTLAREQGWQVVNVDATVPAERVNVKATTNEGMGFIGRGEGIAALAVTCIER